MVALSPMLLCGSPQGIPTCRYY